MLNRVNTFIIISALGVSSIQPVLAEDVLSTLFTTKEERQLIDSNRYKSVAKQQVQAEVKQQQEQQVTTVRETVKLEFNLSGFTLTQSGQNVAWINGTPYENRAELQGGSKLLISGKSKLHVQIQTPDGKYHSLAVGEVKEIEYLEPLEEG